MFPIIYLSNPDLDIYHELLSTLGFRGRVAWRVLSRDLAVLGDSVRRGDGVGPRLLTTRPAVTAHLGVEFSYRRDRDWNNLN
jgi:hypothetical protein